MRSEAIGLLMTLLIKRRIAFKYKFEDASGKARSSVLASGMSKDSVASFVVAIGSMNKTEGPKNYQTLGLGLLSISPRYIGNNASRDSEAGVLEGQ